MLCEIIQPIWIRIEEFLYTFGDEDITFNVETVITNKLVADPCNVKNFVCLLFKQYLYRQRCLSQKPNFEQFTQLVYQAKNIERFIATKNNKLSKHNAKWNVKNNYINLSYYDQEVN